MCRSSNPETSATSGPTCANASPSTVGWESGWIVFLDQNHDGTRDYNSDSALDDRLLRVHGPNTSLNLINDSGGATKLKFTSTGRLLNVSSATTLTFGASDGASLVKYVCIGLGGRARIGTDAEPCP
jgi:hypothetical protein